MPAQQEQRQQFEHQIMDEVSSLSTIAILKRHPMYDSLVLIKKYSPHLDGFSLEFPSSQLDQTVAAAGATKPGLNNQHLQEQQANGRRQNNPIELHQPNSPPAAENECILGKAYDIGGGRTKLVSVYLDGDDPICQHKLKQPNGGDRHKNGEVVYVPINGLLHRLNNYDKLGISIDSRVYAFAMGLKTAERFLTSSTEKEVQEAPPLQQHSGPIVKRIMAVFLVNQCKFTKLPSASDPQASPAPTIGGNGRNICGLKFDSLLDLIHHIEDNHITDVEFQGISSIHPAYYSVSYPSTTGSGHLVQVVQHPHTPLTPHTPQTPHTPHTPQTPHTPHPPPTPHSSHHQHHHLPHHQQQVYSDNLRMQNIINGHWLPTSCILRIFGATHKPASAIQTMPSTPLNTYTSIPGAQYYQPSPTVYAPVFNSGIQMPVQQIPAQNPTYIQQPQSIQQQSAQPQIQLSPQQQPQQALQTQPQQINQTQPQQALQASIQLAPQQTLQAPMQQQLQAPMQLAQPPIHLPSQSPLQTQLQTQIQTPMQTQIQAPIQTPIQTPIPTPIQASIQTPIQAPLQAQIQLPQSQQQPQSQPTHQTTPRPTPQSTPQPQQAVVKTEKIKCPECGRLYKTQKNFNIHMQNNHNKNNNGEKMTTPNTPNTPNSTD